MPRPRTSSPLVLALMVAILAASLAGGWFVTAQVIRGGGVALTAADPAEPPYDAGDPVGDAGPAVEQAAPSAPQMPSPAAPGSAAATTEAPESATPANTPPLGIPEAIPPPVTPAVPRSAPSRAGGRAPQQEPSPEAEPKPEPQLPPQQGSPPDPQPVPRPQPEPAPKPQPERVPTVPSTPSPSPTPTPPRTDPGPTLTPYDPPPAIGIAAEALPAEGRSWSIVTTARRRASKGSQQRTDLDWVVAFAREAMAASAPEGRRAIARRVLRTNAWWYQRRGAPSERVIARDPDGMILTYKRGHGFMVNPVATIGRWRGLNDLWSAAQLAEPLDSMLVARNSGGRDWAALEYFDVPGSPGEVRPGVSAMAQARAASLFAKAWSTTRDPRFLDAAQRVLAAFLVPVDDGGVLATVRDPDGGQPGTWYPERAYPGEDAWLGGALNGFMVTLIELERASTALGRTPEGAVGAGLAGDVADRGRQSLVRFLPQHDSGDWSYYGLLTPGKPWRSYLADLNYHCYHVSLLRTLDGVYAGDGLGRTAERWQRYVDARGATCPAR